MQISLQHANQIADQYAAALARHMPKNGIARFESWLPCPPEIVIQAIKIACAIGIQSRSFSQELRSGYGTAISSLSSFVPDEKAQRINSTCNWSADEKFEQRNSDAFRELDAFRNGRGEGLNRRNDFENFIGQLEQADPSDPLFLQHAYNLAGSEYVAPEQKRGFWQIFSGVA